MSRNNSCNGTDKTCGTFFHRYALQAIQKHLILNVIRSIFPCIASGIDARLFVQIINLQSGIIRQYNIIALCCHCFCFDQCIFFKGCSIFHDIQINAGFFHRKDFPAKISQNFMDFTYLIFISCCKYNSLFHSACPSFLS